MNFFDDIGEVGRETLRDVLPIIIVFLVFQFFVLRRPLPNWRRSTIGAAYVVGGLVLFLLGLERALFPLGRVMARQLSDPSFLAGAGAVAGDLAWTDYYWVYVFALALGFGTTIAEPALLAVALKASEVSGGAISATGLRVAVAIGASVGIALGSLRVITGAQLQWFIIGGYVMVVVQTYFAPRVIVAPAYDSGGVTTSTVTVPLVAALGLGLAETVPGRSPLVDGFGLIAFAALFPIMSVMAYAQLAQFVETRRARAPTKATS